MFGGGVAGAFAGMAGVHIIIKVVDQATKQIHKIIKAMGGLQAVAGVAALMFGGAVIAMGIKRFAEFEDVMVDVQKTANLTTRELKIVTNQIRELARNSRMSHIELAKIAFVAGQLGIAKSQIATFTKMIEMMSVALDLSGDTMAKVLGKIRAAFRMSAEEVWNYMNLVNQLTNEFAVFADEVLDAVLRAASAASILEIPIERLTAMATALIKAGIDPERVGTGLRRMLQYMVKNQKKMAAAMGMSVEDFRAAVNENAFAVIETFIKMAQEGEDKVGVLTAVTEIFGMKASEGIGLLSASNIHYTETLAIAIDETKYANSIQREYAQKMGTTAAKFDLMSNALNDAMIVLGASFAPAVVNVTVVLNKIIWILPTLIKFVMALGFALIVSKNAFIKNFAAALMNIKIFPLQMKVLAHLRAGFFRLGLAIDVSIGKIGMLILAFILVLGAVGVWTGAIDALSFAFMALSVAIAIARAAAGDVTGAINAAITAAAMGVISLAFRADLEKVSGGLPDFEEQAEKEQAIIDGLAGVEGELKNVDGTMKQVNARDMSISIPLYITFERETMEGMDKVEFEQFVYDTINNAIIDGLKAADLYEVVP